MGFNILGKGFEQSAMNHGLASISASLKQAGHECILLDLRAFTGWEHFESALKQQSFDVALMGMYSVDEKYAIECARLLKTYFPDKPLIVGGVHITYCKVDEFPYADCVVWGEGDKITLDLLSILEQGRTIPKKVIAPMIEDLDTLPFVDRNLFTKQEQDFPLFPLLPKPHYTVNFSRGCPWKCTFCFTGDMEVLTDDGLIKIEEIVEKQRYVDVQSHDGSYNEITKYFKRHHTGDILEIELDNIDNVIKCTPEHPFYVYDNKSKKFTWKNADELTTDDEMTMPYLGKEHYAGILKKDKSVWFNIAKQLICLEINKITKKSFNGTVYNLEIENTNTYNIFGINVHNCAESLNVLWKKYRVRSPENCIAELKTLEPIGSLMIHDDHLPTGNWIYKFIELWDKEIGRRVPFWCQIRADWIVKHQDIIPEMARIGFTWNSLGIEGSQRMLDFYNKRLTTEQVIEAAEILHANKINIFGNYIIGAPTETQEDLDELETILDRIRPQWHSPSTYTSYPGSALYEYVKENDLWAGDIDNPNAHYSQARYPYERCIKSVDYNKIFHLRATWPSKYKGELLHYDK